jgi:PAS domain-containing protein
MFMSEEYARILGLPEKQKMISMAEFLTFVHQDDYSRISTLVTESVRDGLTMRAEFRIIRADGATRTILGIGDPVGWAAGERVLRHHHRHHHPAQGRRRHARRPGRADPRFARHDRRAVNLVHRA